MREGFVTRFCNLLRGESHFERNEERRGPRRALPARQHSGGAIARAAIRSELFPAEPYIQRGVTLGKSGTRLLPKNHALRLHIIACGVEFLGH